MKRVDQLLSAHGLCSRKDAREWVRAGRVENLGKPVTDVSTRVDAHALTVDGEPLEFPDGLLVMMNKPVGAVCSHDSREGQRIYDLLPERWQRRTPVVTTVGRLDRDTSGLLLVTDQGPLIQRLTSPKHHVEKTYVARLDQTPTHKTIEQFSNGVELKEEGGALDRTAPATLRILQGTEVEVTLHEGRYHQVKRMFAALGFYVTALHRTRFGRSELGQLEVGEWKAISASEVL